MKVDVGTIVETEKNSDHISILLLSTLGVRSANGYDWKFKFRIQSQPSNHIICLLLIKCSWIMCRSLNLTQNILATRTATQKIIFSKKALFILFLHLVPKLRIWPSLFYSLYIAFNDNHLFYDPTIRKEIKIKSAIITASSLEKFTI